MSFGSGGIIPPCDQSCALSPEGEASDMVRVPVTTSKLPSTEENFTISFVRNGSTCEMRFDWEQTRASVTVQEEKP